MNWFKRLFSRPTGKRLVPAQPVKNAGKPSSVVFRSVGLEVTLDTWRQQPLLVSTAAEIVASQTFQHMLECVRAMSPANMVLPDGIPLQDRAVQQARTEGYNQAIEIILLMGKPWHEFQMPEEDYGVPESLRPKEPETEE